MDLKLPEIAPSSVIVSSKKSNPFKKLFFLLVILLIIAILGLGAFYFYSSRHNQTNNRSENKIEEIETPLFSFSGNIEQINSASLVVSDNVYIPDRTPITDNTPLKPGTTKTITYNVAVSPQTKIIISAVNIPYDLKTSSPSATLLQLNQLKKGQRVTIGSSQDIKSLSINKIEATSIEVYPGLTIVQGTVESLSGNTLTLKALPPSVSEATTYQFSIDKDTEIVTSSASTDSTKPRKKNQLPTSALKANTSVTVYTDTDIKADPVTKALKIDILPFNLVNF